MDVLDFQSSSDWHSIFYDTPSKKILSSFREFLQKDKNQIVRLYHGTDSSLHDAIMKKGLLQTSLGRKRSFQSTVGYVYLSVYPGMAKAFGELAYPTSAKGITVYSVDVKISNLKPDLDQLANQRLWGERCDLGNSLAESLAYGHGARYKGSISPMSISIYHFN